MGDRNERRRRGEPRPAPRDSRREQLDAALRRMLDAEAGKQNAPDNAPWEAWQRAAADYWVSRHPEAASLRRAPEGHVPTAAEMAERAEALNVAHRSIESGWRLSAPSAARNEQQALVGWFHELHAGLYGPMWRARQALRAGDLSGVEVLVRFLEADAYCDRSGYEKQDAIDALKRVELEPTVAARLRAVVLAVVDGYDRREFRAYVRLARKVDSPGLREALEARAAIVVLRPGGVSRSVRHASWVLAGLGVRPAAGTGWPTGGETVELYCPVGQPELERIREAGWQRFPPRPPRQRIIHLLLDEALARDIARHWNATREDHGYRGFVTRFRVRSVYIARFEPRTVGAGRHLELRVPIGNLEEVNDNIVGPIVVVVAFRGSPDAEPTEIPFDPESMTM